VEALKVALTDPPTGSKNKSVKVRVYWSLGIGEFGLVVSK